MILASEPDSHGRHGRDLGDSDQNGAAGPVFDGVIAGHASPESSGRGSAGSGSGEVGSGGRGSGEVDFGPVLLTTVYDPIEAEIIVAKLRSAGIESFVKHEALSVVYGLTVDGCGRQDIMVRAEDLEEARVALEHSS